MLTDLYKRFLAGEEVEIWPSRGTNAVPIAFNPNTGSDLREHVERAAHPEARRRRQPQVIGANSTGVTSPAARRSNRATCSVISSRSIR